MSSNGQYEQAERFLKGWRISFDELLKHIQPVGASETLLLVGSIAEGRANPLSDIDIMIIGNAELKADLLIDECQFSQTVKRLPDGQEINVEYWKQSDVENIAMRFTSVVEAIEDTNQLKKISSFNEMELRFLHRVKTGVVLANADHAKALREKLRVDALADYLALYWLSEHLAYREDAISQIQYGDALTALSSLRLAMDALAAVVLASVGETHFHQKWRPRLLQHYQDDIGNNTTERLLPFLFPSLSSDAEVLVRDAIGLADQLIVDVVTRREHLVPAIRALNERVHFVSALDERVADHASV